ncbi:MAG: hypothetical protein WD770_08680 [Actinomycetota bacterium]
MRSMRLALVALVFVLALGAPAGALPLIGGQSPATSWTLGGQACDLIEVRTAAPIGVALSCPGVRPGAIVESDAGQCTFNFVFNGSDGRSYIGTAGHCILPGDGEQSWAPGTGPEARDASGARVGEFAYAVLQDPKDFSLIRLDPGVPVNPQMCHFGGPTGINSATTSATTVLHHFGQGLGVGLLVPGRSAVAVGMPDPDHVFAMGAVVPGDSGSGIISSDGRAVGVIVTTGVHIASLGTSGVDAGLMGVTRLAPQLARANQVTGVSYSIVTAPAL